LGPSALVLCNRFHTLAMTRPLAPPAAEEPPTVALHEPHTQPAADVAHHLGVSPADGLAADEVATRLARDGHNRLPEAAPRSMWQRVLDQFRDFMILVLLAAAVLSGLIGDLADTVVILIIVVLNAAIGFWQEWQADQASAALQRMAARRPWCAATGARGSAWTPNTWCPVTWCCWKRATWCRPICACTRWRGCGWTSRL
jgi:magnesium-transporting ATPase (P-type)